MLLIFIFHFHDNNYCKKREKNYYYTKFNNDDDGGKRKNIEIDFLLKDRLSVLEEHKSMGLISYIYLHSSLPPFAYAYNLMFKYIFSSSFLCRFPLLLSNI